MLDQLALASCRDGPRFAQFVGLAVVTESDGLWIIIMAFSAMMTCGHPPWRSPLAIEPAIPSTMDGHLARRQRRAHCKSRAHRTRGRPSELIRTVMSSGASAIALDERSSVEAIVGIADNAIKQDIQGSASFGGRLGGLVRLRPSNVSGVSDLRRVARITVEREAEAGRRGRPCRASSRRKTASGILTALADAGGRSA